MDTFSKTLWESDVQLLTNATHRTLAREIFDYVTKRLNSIPFQRYSSRKSKSDGETIFRTHLHRSFWMLLNTKSGVLDIRFPDKMQRLSTHDYFTVKQSPGTQWTRKRERRVTVPLPFPAQHTDKCFEVLELIHALNVEWYGRGRDSSVTLLTLFGSAGSKKFATLEIPDRQTFESVLSTPSCNACGSAANLNVVRLKGAWMVVCDEHYPSPSQWRNIDSLVKTSVSE